MWQLQPICPCGKCYESPFCNIWKSFWASSWIVMGVLVTLASMFLAAVLTLKVMLAAWKYSGLELDHIACFAELDVGLDYSGECSWKQETCPFCGCPWGKMNSSQLVGGEKQVVRPFVVLDSMWVECLGTVFYLFIGFHSVFVKEKYQSSRWLRGSCQIVGTSNSIFFYPLSNLSDNSILFTFIHFIR